MDADIMFKWKILEIFLPVCKVEVKEITTKSPNKMLFKNVKFIVVRPLFISTTDVYNKLN